MRRTRRFSVGDPLLLVLVLVLAFFGIAMVRSAGALEVPTITSGLWKMQLTWFGLALLLIPMVLKVPVIWLEWMVKPIYVAGLGLLVLALAIGTGAGTAESMSGWIAVGPVRIQPSELAKVAVILMLARVLSEWKEPPRTLWKLWKPILVVMLPMALVMLQPDLGTALVFGSILLFTLFWAGTPGHILFFLISPIFALFLSFSPWIWGAWIAFVAGVIWWKKPFVSESLSILGINIGSGMIAQTLWNSLAPYQKNRFLVFLDPNIDPRGAGYNLIQSQVAIGSGGVFGKGYMEGSQKRLAFLPEQHTDFIFSVVGEEWGFVGVLVVFLIFGGIFMRLVRVAQNASDPYAGLIPIGLLGSWFAHVLVNTGMTVGVMPITGIPLPFLSYGGSFLLVNLLAVAIILRVALEGRSQPLPGGV